MSEIIEYGKSYTEFKTELNQQLNTAAESFVKIGYLLKVARDTGILHESPYTSVTEFAKAEYGLDKTQVSRFIRINDKFAAGGYSDRLEEKYQGFGFAKLSIMLLLPDAINDELTPAFSKAEIQAVKDEIEEEHKTSDIEVMLEGEAEKPQHMPDDNLSRAVYQLMHDESELFLKLWDIMPVTFGDMEAIKRIMAPAGEKIYSVRVRGLGRLMLSLKDEEDTVVIINSRSGEKEEYTWSDIDWCLSGIVDKACNSARENWEKIYDEEMIEVAPVQPKTVPAVEKRLEPRKETKVSKSKKPESKKEKPAVQKPDAVPAPMPEKLPGQMVIEDYPEAMPKRQEPESVHAEVMEDVADSIKNTASDEVEGQERFMNRKEYMDELTAYGMAIYMKKEFNEGRLTADMLGKTIPIEKWLLEDVEANGEPLEE